MNEYIVYFEIFGKRMKTAVKATSEPMAEMLVKEKLNVLKIKKVQNENDNDIISFLRGFQN